MTAPELGVFARVFPPGSPSEVAVAIRASGFVVTQLNLSVLGRPTLDADLDVASARAIGSQFRAAGVRIWALSGTFNAIDPDERRRAAATAACVRLIARAPDVGAEVVTLCTGTRDESDIWRAHPDNQAPAAWLDLRRTLEPLLAAADAAGVRLGIEPEPGNVVRDAAAASRLLAELGPQAERIAIVLDPANLLRVDTLPEQDDILGRAFAELGPAVGAVHAKDVVAGGYAAPGAGGMDYDLVMRLHAALPRPVPVIAQDLDAADAGRVHDFLASHVARG